MAGHVGDPRFEPCKQKERKKNNTGIIIKSFNITKFSFEMIPGKFLLLNVLAC